MVLAVVGENDLKVCWPLFKAAAPRLYWSIGMNSMVYLPTSID